MKQIPLTKGQVAIVDDVDYEHVSAHSWFVDAEGYAATNIRRGIGKWRVIRMHKFLVEAREVDHRDGNKLNNQRGNLRPCTRSQNNQNAKKRKSGSSRYKGVSWKGGRHNSWLSVIKVNGRQVFLGHFKDEIEAAKAYDKAARKHFGEFARPNFEETHGQL